ncbi:MAG: SIS domain-containing protein [Chloroflexota bacterium]
MTSVLDQFYAHVKAQLEQVMTLERTNIEAAAAAVADALQNDRDFLTFGSGHSALVAHEVMWRAGGLAPAMAIQDHTGGDAERIEGVAKLILGHYVLRAGSVLVVISNSGINAVPVEAAMIGRDAGLTVVAITALAHSQDVPSRHSSGKKLYELADIVIDSHTPRGDTSIALPGSDLRTGATSTLAGVMIIDAITAEAAALLDTRGIEPPLLVSANVPDGDAHNLALKQKYLPRLSRFPIDTADLADVP